jgi:hypothetical protein
MVPIKFSNSCSSLLLLVILLGLFVPLNQMDASSQSRIPKADVSNRGTQYVIYENSSYGIRLEFPKSWEFQVGENTSEYPFEVVYFYNNPSDNNYFGDFVISIAQLNRNYSMQDYVENTIDQYEKNNDGFKLDWLSLNNSLGGLRAYSISYSQRYNATHDLKTLEVGTLRGNLVYFVEYYAFEKEFDLNLPIARKMIDSIEFLNPGLGLPDLAYGPLNSDHQHASFAVVINNATIDFSEDKYQLKSPLIHVENKDGRTIHRHASNIPILHFFNTIGMNINGVCFFHDNGSKYCANDKADLRFFLNGAEVSSISEHVIRNGDEILILYGNESIDLIRERLIMLNQAIKPLFPS